MSFFACLPLGGSIRSVGDALRSGRLEVAVIDTSLADWAILRDGLKAGTEVVLIDGREDGLLALAQALQGRTGIDALHVLSHGFAGGFVLGSATLDASTLDRYTPALRAIGASLADEADILLYSCWTARGAGPALLSALSAITGANVAASYTLTGAASQGGDWALGYRLGHIMSGVVLTDAAMQGYQHTLPGIQGPPGPAEPPPPPPPPLTIALANDTGSSASDNITNDAALHGTANAGAFVVLTEGVIPLGTVLASGTGAWTFTPTLSDGTHTIVASGSYSSSTGTLTFTLDTTPPAAPASLALAPGSDSSVPADDLTNVTRPTLTGTGETGDTLTLYDGNVAIGTTTVVNSTWSVTPSVALLAGSHALMARQTDPAGNVSPVSSLLPLVIDTTIPVAPSGLGLAPPSDSGTLGDGITSATSPLIIGTGTTLDTVKIYDGTTLLGSTSVAPGGAWYFAAGPLADGTHSLTATQNDAAGNVSAASAPFALTIETGTPNLTAMLAANPHDTASATYNQVLDGGGDANASVTITDGGTVVGTVVADATGAWSFDLAGLAAGSHSLVASEANAAGATGVSAAVSLTVAAAVVPDTRFTVATGSTATSGKFFGSDYSGPLRGLQAQYGYVGTDNVNVVANVANTFIYSGTVGEDALVAHSGSNVLDSRGGSDWMIGASGADGGADTFFVDSRTSGSPTTWDTALNFHAGDKLTIWDFSPATGSMSFTDNLGQPGYTGTTLQADLGNGATDLVTFAGLSGGASHFATSTGVTGGLGYLAITRVA